MPGCDVKTRYIPATFAWTLLLGATTLFFYFPAQYYIFLYPWVLVYQGVITFFVLANFTLATFMDPGVIPKAPPDEDREDDFRAPLYKNVDINGITVRMKWCVTCKFYRPPRCSHCSVCNHCIETFDHHCPWVNNCIGRRNYRFFFFFLISLSLHMISIFTLSLVYVLQKQEKLTEKEPIISIILMVIVVFLAVPIFGLTGFHMVLVSRGRTTNEQVTGKFKGGYNPFSRGCWDNCCYTQFGPQFPSLIKPTKYHSKKKHCSHGPISTITNESQVKTYMDNSNGIRNMNSNAYNKLSPSARGDGLDPADMMLEAAGASQSQDCDPTPPPLQRHGSKTNFFLQQSLEGPNGGSESPRHPNTSIGSSLPPTSASNSSMSALAGNNSQRQSHIVGQYARHSPHPRPRGLDPVAMRAAQDGANGAQQQTRPSPTMQQRIKAMGVPTPLTMSHQLAAAGQGAGPQGGASPIRRSNPSTPTQPRRPTDFINSQPINSTSSPISAQNQPSYLPPHHPNQPTYSTQHSATYYDYQHPQQPPQLTTFGNVRTSTSGGGSNQPQYASSGGSYVGVTADRAGVYYHGVGGGYHHSGGSPQRRFLSEGELVRQEALTGAGGGVQLSYARGNNTVDNIRELANSPQRSMYLWKDTSPSYPTSGGPQGSGPHPSSTSASEFYRSNPTSPTQQQHQQYNQMYGGNAGNTTGTRPYHPAMRGGVPVFPPQPPPGQSGGQSPGIHRKGIGSSNPQLPPHSTPTTSNSTSSMGRRPMSFVRALEMSDSVDMSHSPHSNSPNNHPAPSSGAAQQQSRGGGQQGQTDSPDRTSVYDMNYEISV